MAGLEERLQRQQHSLGGTRGMLRFGLLRPRGDRRQEEITMPRSNNMILYIPRADEPPVVREPDED
jgi:hypothetical protein